VSGRGLRAGANDPPGKLRETYLLRVLGEVVKRPHARVRRDVLGHLRPGERDAVLTALHGRGVMARAVFTPMHRLEMYRDDGGTFPAADEIFARAICLPAGIELAKRFA